MKRTILIILTVAMLLCSCSAAAGSQDGTGLQPSNNEAQPSNNGDRGIAGFFFDIVDSIGDAVGAEEEPLLELGKGTKQNSIAILKITVNPEFELYLDTDSCVSRVRCLNEDAVTAFQNMTSNEINVIGLAYADAIPVILDALSIPDS